jgi:hypothetical protein
VGGITARRSARPGGVQGAEYGAGGAAFFDEVLGLVHRVAEGCDGRGAMGITFEPRDGLDGVLDVREENPGKELVKRLAGFAGK